jgi:transcriptional regulatory protein LevR
MVYTLLEDEPVKLKDIGNKNEKLAIITVCTTGEGGAVTIKNILSENLHFDKKLVEILPIMYSSNKEIEKKVKELSKEYKIICIISPFKINTEIMQFGLESVLRLEDTEIIQREIDVETTYIKMGQTLEKQLKNVSGIEVLENIKNFNDTIIESLSLKISTNILIGETFHVACMIDR